MCWFQIKVPKDAHTYPVNLAFLQILGVNFTGLGFPTLTDYFQSTQFQSAAADVERILLDLSNYLKHAKTEKGGAVSSDCLSRLVQRRLITILSAQLVTDEGRASAIR
jgi:hypothetical protein